MHWLQESWCVGRWHLINLWSDILGLSGVRAGFCRNPKVFIFPLSEKASGSQIAFWITFIDEMKSVRMFVATFTLIGEKPLALCVKAEMLSSHHPTKFLMCRWALRWKVLLCGLYLRGQVWIARCPCWAGHCFDVWPSAIGEHFPAFSHWEITILSTSLGEVMYCLKKCFGTLGSKISHVVGDSIHCISCKGDTQCSGKLVNSFSLSSLRWMNLMSLSFWSCAQTPQCTQPCHVTLSSPVQILSILWNGWSWPIGPLLWLSGNGSSMLGELLGCCEESRGLITPPHRRMLGKGGIHKAVGDKCLV